MLDYKQIFNNNQTWVEQKLREDRDFFNKLSKSQKPNFLYIGCSDSRVSAEEMLGAKPGELFVHRNIANLVNALDINATTVIQYAVEHLNVKHILICGHYGCGGVKAAMRSEDFGLINPWLRIIRDVYRLHNAELDSISDEEERFARLIELNIEEQCINVMKMACVQEMFILNGYPTVHGLVFNLKTGLLKDLNIDFLGNMENIQHIYNLQNSYWIKNHK